MSQKTDILSACRIMAGLLILMIIPLSATGSCPSCGSEKISTGTISLQDIDPANLSAFRTIDTRDIGRAMDISGFSPADLEKAGDII